MYIVCCFYWLYVYFKSLVFDSFIHLFKPPGWDSGFKTRICPPYPHATGKKATGMGRFLFKITVKRLTRVGALFLYFWFFFIICLLVFSSCCCCWFFFLLGEVVSFNMYSYSTFVIVVYFIFLSGKWMSHFRFVFRLSVENIHVISLIK